jgi:hypothetical protein
LEDLFIAAGVLAGLLAVKLVIWAVATRPGWSRIRDAALYAGFGLAATFAFFAVAGWSGNVFVAILAFIALVVLCFHVAKSLNQI